MKDAEKAADNYARVTGRGPCLIPKEGHAGIICHEMDYCQCDIKEAFTWGAAYQAEQDRKRIADLEFALEELVGCDCETEGMYTVIKCTVCKVLDGQALAPAREEEK